MNTIIQTPTSNLQRSLDFYKKLNFTSISSEQEQLLTDGSVVVEINAERIARAGIKLYSTTWEDTISLLKDTHTITDITDGYLLSSPSGVWVYLLERAESENIDLSGFKKSVLGNFAGVSLETTAIKDSIQFWNILGFEQTMGSIEAGWICLANKDGMSISLMVPLMCPHLFFNPSLTYFNGKDNLNIIQEIRNRSIPITEEITHFNKEGVVDNIIIRDPGGLGFFIFSD